LIQEATFPTMLTYIVLGIHIVLCLALVGLVLLHSGRGGGLSDMFGGGGGSIAAGSTMVEKNLNRMTVAAGLTWVFTTAILAIRLQ
jgi:preprotein translocase subunit SecG